MEKPTTQLDHQWAEAEFYDDQIRVWDDSLPKFDEHAWLDIFPECKPLVIKETRRQIKALQEQLQEIIRDTREIKNNPGAIDPYWLQRQLVFVQQQHEDVSRRLKAKQYLLKTLAGAPENPDHIGPAEIQRASRVPLVDLVGLPAKRLGKKTWFRCPFHDEKTPSFAVDESNRWHCFGACSEGGDVIDFVKKQHGLQFLEAVRWLLSK